MVRHKVKKGVKTVNGVLLEWCENGENKKQTEVVQMFYDCTRCPRGSRSIVCMSKPEEHLGSANRATGKLETSCSLP